MTSQQFQALVVRQNEKIFSRSIETRNLDDLPAGEVVVRVQYSSLNYKDALSAIGNRGVTRKFPHTPGIDAAGIVESSESPAIKEGDKVLVCCYDLGMNTPGGFGQLIRVPADWVVPLPANLTMKEAMIYGTAGFTAALSVFKLLEQGVNPAMGKILVTGATGGVGSVAVAILAQEGFDVVAASGKQEDDFLQSMGASEVIHREKVSRPSGKALLRTNWAGAVDTVGGDVLANVLKTTKPGGAVTCCGNVASGELPITVYPFILRGISLLGVDAAECPIGLRKKIWDKIAMQWKLSQLDQLCSEIGIDQLDNYIDRILAGKTRGRVVVNMMGPAC